MLPDHVKKFKLLAKTLYAIANDMGDGTDLQFDICGMCDDYARQAEGLNDGEKYQLANMLRQIVGLTKYDHDEIFTVLCPEHMATACLNESDMRKAIGRGLGRFPALADITFVPDAMDLIVQKGCGEIANTFWILRQAVELVKPDKNGRRIITKEIVEQCDD